MGKNLITLRHHPHHAAGEIENAALFHQLAPTVHTNLSRKQGYSKTLSKTLSKTPAFVSVWTENILKTELFKNDDVTIIM